MPNNAASHLGLHCLLVSYLETLGINWLNAQKSRAALCLVYIPLHHLFPYLVCENREGFGETACMHRLAQSFAGHPFDGYSFHLYELAHMY